MKEYRLRRNDRLRLDRNAVGRIISCREGVLWLTQTGNPGDYLVRAGEVFSSDRPGRLVIGALADSVFTVETGNAVSDLSAGILPHVLRRMVRRFVIA